MALYPPIPPLVRMNRTSNSKSDQSQASPTPKTSRTSTRHVSNLADADSRAQPSHKTTRKANEVNKAHADAREGNFEKVARGIRFSVEVIDMLVPIEGHHKAIGMQDYPEGSGVVRDAIIYNCKRNHGLDPGELPVETKEIREDWVNVPEDPESEYIPVPGRDFHPDGRPLSAPYSARWTPGFVPDTYMYSPSELYHYEKPHPLFPDANSLASMLLARPPNPEGGGKRPVSAPVGLGLGQTSPSSALAGIPSHRVAPKMAGPYVPPEERAKAAAERRARAAERLLRTLRVGDNLMPSESFLPKAGDPLEMKIAQIFNCTDCPVALQRVNKGHYKCGMIEIFCLITKNGKLLARSDDFKQGAEVDFLAVLDWAAAKAVQLPPEYDSQRSTASPLHPLRTARSSPPQPTDLNMDSAVFSPVHLVDNGGASSELIGSGARPVLFQPGPRIGAGFASPGKSNGSIVAQTSPGGGARRRFVPGLTLSNLNTTTNSNFNNENTGSVSARANESQAIAYANGKAPQSARLPIREASLNNGISSVSSSQKGSGWGLTRAIDS